MNGWGLRFHDGSLAIGNWKDGALDGGGYVVDISKKIVIVGTFRGGNLEGWGVLQGEGQKYYGMLKEGCYDGTVSDILRFWFDNSRED
jgi:hypothetical protein